MASGIRVAEDGGVAYWLCEPVGTLPAHLRRGILLFLSLCTFGICALMLRFMERPFEIPDTREYLLMAQGRMGAVRQPFASRPLEPLVAGWLAGALHMRVETGFAILTCLSFGFTLLVVLRLAMHTEAPRWLLLAMCAVPFWPQLMHGMGLPDAWYAALLAVLLLFVEAERPYLAALMLFPLMLSRESTSLTLVCFVAAAWPRLQWRGSALAVLCAAAGSMVVRHLGAAAQANAEHLPQTLYLVGKAPWNFVRTLGIQPWSNLYPYLCSTPEWQHALHIGRLRAVGVCTTSATAPREATVALLTTYGLLLPLLLVVWRRRERVRREDLLLRFSLLYGGISFLLPPLLGTWYLRFFGYAWPLFLVALPRLYRRTREASWEFETGGVTVAAVAMFVGLHVALGRMAFFFRLPGPLIYCGLFVGAGAVLLLSPAGRILLASARPEPSAGVVKSG